MLRLSDLLDPDVEVDWATLPVGNQTPTHRLVAEAQFSHGPDFIRLAELAGYNLDDFQKEALIDFLGANMVEVNDEIVERWAADETCDVESRRNGKSVVIEVIILGGLYLLGEKIMYTAHRDDTAKEIFDRVVAAIERTPALWAEVVDSGPRRTNGQREVKLKSGAVCLFRTRTLDTARGQGFDRLILDEVQNLLQAHMAALAPLMTGQPNGQTNYAGSAGDRSSEVLAGLWRSFQRRQRLFSYRGWHLEPDVDVDDVEAIARVNPAVGRRLPWSKIAAEFKRMSLRMFGRERAGIATYPREDGTDWVIPEPAWLEAQDLQSEPRPNAVLWFVPEADPDLSEGSISVAGRRADGAMHIEVTAFDDGTGWIPRETVRLADEHGGHIAVDPKSPAAAYLPDIRNRLAKRAKDQPKAREIRVHEFVPVEIVDACTWLYTRATPRPDPADPGAGVPPPGVYHRGGRVLTTALAAAETRKLMDRWAWNRFNDTNIGPLFGVTLAAYAVVLDERGVPDETPTVLPTRGSNRQSTPRRNPRQRSGDPDLTRVGF